MPKKQKAKIILTEEPDNTVSITMEFDPPVDDDTKSCAVHTALDAIKFLLGKNKTNTP